MNTKYFLWKRFLSQLIFTDSDCFIEIEIAKEKIPLVLSKSSLRNLKQLLIWQMIKSKYLIKKLIYIFSLMDIIASLSMYLKYRNKIIKSYWFYKKFYLLRKENYILLKYLRNSDINQWDLDKDLYKILENVV